KMKEEGVEDVVIEATSHGLDQRRLHGLAFMIGIMTNISAEHLDYHGNLAEYTRAKARLLRQSALAVLNADDATIAALESASQPTVTYGLDNPAMISADNIKSTGQGSVFTVHLPGDEHGMDISIPLPGSFNISNSLAAISAA